MAGLFGVLALAASGVLVPVRGVAQGVPSIQSRETRVALLAMFDQLGTGLASSDESTRSRANRRHPDVGFLSSDPICLSCVMTVLDPPVLPPPQPRQPSPILQPANSSRPLLPAPKPAAAKPAAPKPAVAKPAAPKPTIKTSPLPGVLTPAQVKIRIPLEPQPTPDLIELTPQSIPLEPVPLQEVPDILTAEAPIQTPGPMPILGLGAAIGVSRRLRKRIKAARRQHVH